MKLGSLFDGIGGFPFSAVCEGIQPVWASEIEKNCIKVTEMRFPNVKHLGSVTDINGANIEPVDIITFGSPCQDLSVAGKRAGLDGARSGLFMEAVRIIREMRDAIRLRDYNDECAECVQGSDAAVESGNTRDELYSNNGGNNGTNRTFPRYAVWENVPGAYSSNNGEDFRTVIESLAQIAQEGVSIPMPEGRWERAGLVEGDGWSIAWRTLDAQFWGIPQRRARIFLVADFGGNNASEIFFEREGVCGHTAESRGSGEEVAGGVEGGVGINCWTAGTLSKRMHKGVNSDEHGPTYANIVCVHATQDSIVSDTRAHSLSSNASQAVCFEPRSQDGVPRIHDKGICPTLNTAEGGQRQPCILYNAEGSTGATLTKSNLGAGLNNQTPCLVEASQVRRLTPLECTRLQGYPDNWFDGTGLSDSAKYKALGNSVAIPCVRFVLRCIARCSG